MSYLIPVPLHDAIKKYDDEDLINIINTYKHKLIKNKYDVNEAALCLMDSCQTEWIRRYGNKPVPTIMTEEMMIIEGEIHDTFPY
jgi:hypothetical protein